MHCFDSNYHFTPGQYGGILRLARFILSTYFGSSVSFVHCANSGSSVLNLYWVGMLLSMTSWDVLAKSSRKRFCRNRFSESNALQRCFLIHENVTHEKIKICPRSYSCIEFSYIVLYIFFLVNNDSILSLHQNVPQWFQETQVGIDVLSSRWTPHSKDILWRCSYMDMK
jgi:hypothetical protein